MAAALCLGLAVLLLSLNVSIGGEPWMAGGCVTVNFDKWDMRRADKLVATYNGQQYVSEDADFVRAFAEATLSGTWTEYCCSNENVAAVEIYRGDRLLRRYRYVENHDAFAYEADPTHWVLFGKEGHAFISGDICNQFRQLLGLHTHNYAP